MHPIYRIVVFCAKVLFRELFDGDVYGDENIPRKGPCILACNHLSFFDPPFIGGSVPHREVYSIARSSLFRTKFRNWLFRGMNCIPLNRSSGDIGAIKSALRLLNDGKCIMIYPEGKRSDDGFPGEPQAGVGLLACKTGVPIVPCKISGTYEIMPRGCTFPDWTQSATIIFGKPIHRSEYDIFQKSHDRYRLVAKKIMDEIFCLKNTHA